MRKIELPIKEIVEKYENGTSMEKLGREYGVAMLTISERIREYYEKSGKEQPIIKRENIHRIELPIEEIVEKYENGTSIEKLAREYGRAGTTISERIKEYYEKNNIDRSSVKRPKFKIETKKIELPIEEIVEKYENGITITDLAAEYKISRDTMGSRLKEYYESNGIERPIIKRKNKNVIELPIEEIVEKYENGISMEKLAIEYRTTYATISKRLKEYYEKNEIDRASIKRAKIKVEGRKIELPIEEIVEKYENKISITDLAIEYGTSYPTMNNRLNEYYRNSGIERPVFYNGGKKKKELPIKQIVERYEKGISITDLAIEYGTSYDTMNNRINEYYRNSGIERPVFLSGGRKKIELPIEEIVEKYENGVSIQKLAIEYGTLYGNIWNRIKEYYEKNNKEELPIDEIVQKYENGLSKSKIAREFGVLVSTITNIIKEYYEKSGDEIPTIKVERKKVELPIDEIIQKYENGTSIKNLAIEYNVLGCTIKGKIEGYYKSKGKKVPRILKSLTVIEEYFKKGMSIEEIVEIASNRNIIIPKELIDTVLNDKNIVDEER